MRRIKDWETHARAVARDVLEYDAHISAGKVRSRFDVAQAIANRHRRRGEYVICEATIRNQWLHWKDGGAPSGPHVWKFFLRRSGRAPSIDRNLLRAAGFEEILKGAVTLKKAYDRLRRKAATGIAVPGVDPARWGRHFPSRHTFYRIFSHRDKALIRKHVREREAMRAIAKATHDAPASFSKEGSDA